MSPRGCSPGFIMEFFPSDTFSDLCRNCHRVSASQTEGMNNKNLSDVPSQKDFPGILMTSFQQENRAHPINLIQTTRCMHKTCEIMMMRPSAANTGRRPRALSMQKRKAKPDSALVWQPAVQDQGVICLCTGGKFVIPAC